MTQTADISVSTIPSLDDFEEKINPFSPNILFEKLPVDIKELIRKSSYSDISVVPEERRTTEVYQYFVSVRNDMLERVPEEFKNEAMYITALSCGGKNANAFDGFFIGNIPENMRTRRVCLAAAGLNSINFKDIPQQFLRDKEILLKAGETGSDLASVPKEMWDEDVLEAFVRGNWFNLTHLETSQKTEKLCRIAIDQGFSGHAAFTYIPDKFKDTDMCNKVIERNPSLITYIPKSVLNQEMCNYAVSKIPHLINNIPEEFRTTDLFETAVAIEPNLINSVPKEKRTLAMYQVIEKANAKSSQPIVLK